MQVVWNIISVCNFKTLKMQYNLILIQTLVLSFFPSDGVVYKASSDHHPWKLWMFCPRAVSDIFFDSIKFWKSRCFFMVLNIVCSLLKGLGKFKMQVVCWNIISICNFKTLKMQYNLIVIQTLVADQQWSG